MSAVHKVSVCAHLDIPVEFLSSAQPFTHVPALWQFRVVSN
jgi:hypothetical protein